MLRKPTLTRQAGKRNGNRLRLGVPAGLVMTHSTCRCVIEDVSATGARIQVEEPLAEGRMAMLQFHELRLYGTVIWSRAGKCGIRFERRLTQEDMEGFLWIVQHPKGYARLCQESGVRDWSMGIGD